jgi:diguanylate cyclase (GGDEF)-like protein
VDHVYRYGGEEILVLLEEEDGDAALLAATRIVVAVRALRIAHPGTRAGQITVSVGSAASIGRPMNPWEVIDEADRALYDAKAAGRDRAVAFSLHHLGASSGRAA